MYVSKFRIKYKSVMLVQTVLVWYTYVLVHITFFRVSYSTTSYLQTVKFSLSHTYKKLRGVKNYVFLLNLRMEIK